MPGLHPYCSDHGSRHYVREWIFWAVAQVSLEEQKLLKAMTKPGWDALAHEAFKGVEELREKGQLIAAQALQFVETATTVRVRGGKVSTTDGPFAETKEQLGGFYLIEAKDLKEAIQIASRLPGARLGCIEVRPTRELK